MKQHHMHMHWTSVCCLLSFLSVLLASFIIHVPLKSVSLWHNRWMWRRRGQWMIMRLLLLICPFNETHLQGAERTLTNDNATRLCFSESLMGSSESGSASLCCGWSSLLAWLWPFCSDRAAGILAAAVNSVGFIGHCRETEALLLSLQNWLMSPGALQKHTENMHGNLA